MPAFIEGSTSKSSGRATTCSHQIRREKMMARLDFAPCCFANWPGRRIMKRVLCLLLFALCGCAQIPKGVVAVERFDVQRYLGTWYEIARLDHSFERGLINITATYSLNEDGSLRVVNRGFDPKLNRWKEAEGRGYFVSRSDIGQLRVSFFGPFYGGYNILEIDEPNYSYAIICGNSRSYLWILARQPRLPETVMASLTQKAKNLGFDTDALIYVPQRDMPAKQDAGGGK
jgi:apolipoprotein D and lipocalin family protein